MYAAGRLYDSGPGDDSFKAEYPNVEWVGGNAIRLYAEPRSAVPSFSISLRNASSRRAKWIMLYSQEMFLVLDLDAGVQAALSSLQWGPQALTVTGEWQDGTQIRKRQASLPQWIASVEIAVAESETQIDVRRR